MRTYKPQKIRRRAGKLYSPLRASPTRVVAGMPIRRALHPQVCLALKSERTRNRKNRMGDPGAKIACGIHARAGGPRQCEYEAPHQRGNEEWAQTGGQIRA